MYIIYVRTVMTKEIGQKRIYMNKVTSYGNHAMTLILAYNLRQIISWNVIGIGNKKARVR